MFEEFVCGYHIYRDILTPTVQETLQCFSERENILDKFAVGVYNNGNLVGHVPRDIAR